MKFLYATLITLTLSLTVSAADVEGFLIDKACSAKAVKDGYAKAGAHSKDCLQMDGCADSGMGVLTADNKYILFDKDGAKKATAALAASKKNENVKIKVSGDVKGNTMTVKSISIL